MAPTTRNNKDDSSGTNGEVNSNNASLTPEIQNIINQQVQSQLMNFLKNNMMNPETQQWIAADKAYVTPQFQIRNMQEHEKLQGHRNYKNWRSMIELDLKALNLLPFITSECGDEIVVSPSRRVVLDAQALQYIKASVSKYIAARLNDKFSAYQAVQYLVKNFGNTRIQSFVDVHNKFMRLRFKEGYDANRFVADFEDLINSYNQMGTTFSEDYITTVFLQKIDGIDDHKSPFSSFYSTVTSLPNESQNLEFIKERFLRVASSPQAQFKRKSTEKPENKVTKRSVQSNNNSGDHKAKSLQEKYTPQQLEKLSKMTREERKKIQCTKCGEYYHEANACTNPGKMCFNCFKYGHIKTDCTYEKKEKGNLEQNITYDKIILFLVDSCANFHIVSDKSILIDYKNFDTPQMVKTADKESNLSSVGEGSLRLLVSFGKIKSVIKLNKVQYVPDIDNDIMSVSAFNTQFRATLVLYPKSGHILCRKLGRKIATIEQTNGIYKMRAQVVDDSTELSQHEKITETIKTKQIPQKVVCLKTITRNQIRNAKRKLSPKQLQLLKQEGELWHRRMGHISASVINRVKNVTLGINELICENMQNCDICAQAKLHKKTFNKDRDRATRPCECIHVDLMGPVTPPTFAKKNTYIMCVTDDYTRYLQVFLMKSKNGSETAECMNEALRFLQAQYPGAGQFNVLRCDNGTEFTNSEVRDVLTKYGIVTEESEPYCHQHNGLAERINRTIQERARALLFESGFPVGMWGLAIHAACYIYNRTPHSALDFITPFEKFYEKIPDVTNIRIFGARVYALKETIPKGTKFTPRSNTYYLVGFTKTGYTVYDTVTQKTIETCNVKIDETKLYKNDFPNSNPETFNISNQNSLEPTVVNVPIDNSDLLHPNPSTSNVSQPDEILVIPQVEEENSLGEADDLETHTRYEVPGNSALAEESNSETENESIHEIEIDDDWDDSKNVPIHLNYCFSNPNYLVSLEEKPLTYQEATSHENVAKWGPPIEAELNAMRKHKVFEIVERKKGMQVIPVKWIFTVKEDGSTKARIVAVGCRDKEEYKPVDTASPTPSATTIRWLFAIVVQYSWQITQLDVKNAFLHSEVDREKYVSIPHGFDCNSRKFVCKLNKALYGLATAPKCWNNTFHSFMVSINFVRNEREPCLYSKKNGNLVVVVLVYVDDIIVTGDDKEGIEALCKQLKLKFEIKELGMPRKFLGFQIEWKNDGESVYLHQTKYTDSMLKTFGMSECSPAATPMIPFSSQKEKNTKTKEIQQPYSYKQVIGAILYLSNNTRPDIAFAINYLARFQSDPQEIHWKLLKRVFQYLKGTQDMGLLLTKQKTETNTTMTNTMDAYVDADFAGDKRTRKSTTAYVIRLFGNIIGWCSRLQRCTAESSAEAEYMAICEVARDILFLARLFEEIIGSIEYPLTLFEDSTAAMSISTNSTSKGRVKHIELIYLKTREYFRENILKVQKVNSKQNEQLADFLTKPLGDKNYLLLRSKIMFR